MIRGSREPESETAQQELRVEALRLDVDKAYGQIRKLVDEHRDNWRRRSMRDLAKAKGRYAAAIEELEAARAGLSDSATLIAWIDSGDMSEASTDSLASRTGVDASAKPVLAFSRTLEKLRLDCEHLAAHSDTPRDASNPQPSRVRDFMRTAPSNWGGDAPEPATPQVPVKQIPGSPRPKKIGR